MGKFHYGFVVHFVQSVTQYNRERMGLAQSALGWRDWLDFYTRSNRRPQADDYSIEDGTQKRRVDLPILGIGRWSHVYRSRISFENDRSMTIKIRCFENDSPANLKIITGSGRLEDLHAVQLSLDHRNVQKFFRIDFQDNECWYYLEIFEANLVDWFRGKYDGPIPIDLDGLDHMASGLAYLHSRNLVHGGIKPRNVYLAVEDGVSILKIADFGFYLMGESTEDPDDPFDSQNYLAPEDVLFQTFAVNETDVLLKNFPSDVFALGKVFFDFLTRGDHLFIQRRCELNPSWAGDLIRQMTLEKPEERIQMPDVQSFIQTRRTCIEVQGSYDEYSGDKDSENNKLGNLEDDRRVVKKGNRVNPNMVKFMKDIMRLEHENVQKCYFSFRDELKFPVFILEWGEFTISDWMDGLTPKSIPKPLDGLKQMLSGLDYLHSRLQLVHGNLTSRNIIISSQNILKLADYQFHSIRAASDSDSLRNLNYNYVAPEVRQNKSLTKSCDIFSIGIIFGEYLTRGTHPFDFERRHRSRDSIPKINHYLQTQIASVSWGANPHWSSKILNSSPWGDSEIPLIGPFSYGNLNFIMTKMLARNPESRWTPCQLLCEIFEIPSFQRPPRTFADDEMEIDCKNDE